jgi:hypothetical protein
MTQRISRERYVPKEGGFENPPLHEPQSVRNLTCLLAALDMVETA